MSFDEESLREFARFGIMPGDLVRAGRPNGPLDTVIVSTSCAKCGKKESQSLREMHLKGGRCTCGETYDVREVANDLKAYGTGFRGPFKSICILPEFNQPSSEN